MVFSVCEWGRERPWLWAPGFNAEMWRTTYDVKDKWTSKYDNNGGIGVLRSAHQNEALGPFVGPGRWNDMDMLQIGVNGFDYGHDRKKAGFDRSRIAEFPEPAFVCKQASSYNRKYGGVARTTGWNTLGRGSTAGCRNRPASINRNEAFVVFVSKENS